MRCYYRSYILPVTPPNSDETLEGTLSLIIFAARMLIYCFRSLSVFVCYQRKEIVSAQAEPNDAECEWPSDEEAELSVSAVYCCSNLAASVFICSLLAESPPPSCSKIPYVTSLPCLQSSMHGDNVNASVVDNQRCRVAGRWKKTH